MRRLLVSAILLGSAMFAGCTSVPNHQDAWLSYKYGTNCGAYVTSPCALDDTSQAQAYYVAVGIASPNADNYGSVVSGITNPSAYTFASWLSANGFPATADAHATYANLADLQIGRDMYCAQVGAKVICYVMNYGPAPTAPVWGQSESQNGPAPLEGWATNGAWPDISSALSDVQYGAPFGTVAMIYDPSKTTNQVSFYAFDNYGLLLADPGLDGEGAKTVPRMCMACHGGTYDVNSNSVTGASFLPFDPFAFRYPSGPADGFDAQQESLRKLNALVLATNPNQPIIDLINGMYPNGVTNVGSTPVDGYIPPGWSDDPAVYAGVVRPYCRMCHLAQSESFTSSSDLEGEAGTVQSLVCSSHDMPHAQVPFGISGGSSSGNTVGFWNDAVAQRDLGNLFQSLGVSNCLPTD